jgi:DNA replication protein DnaC
MSFEKQFKVRDFPEEWFNKTLRDLDASAERKLALKKYADFIKGGYSGWIYLNGGIGTGKSFFAAVISIDAANRNLGPICFMNCSSRIREMSELTYKKTSDLQDYINKYSTVPILVLDDFGNEFKSDFIRDAIIYPILSYRASKNLFTIITSDFTIDEIKVMYGINKPGEIRARQIANLLSNQCGEEINLGDLKIHQ